jgi:hypothetical protein
VIFINGDGISCCNDVVRVFYAPGFQRLLVCMAWERSKKDEVVYVLNIIIIDLYL